MNSKLTKRQKEILDYIKRSIVENGYPPSAREIAKEVGLSSSGAVAFQLNNLESLGFIKKDPLKPRTITITTPDDFTKFESRNAAMHTSEIVEIPVLGTTVTGKRFFEKENIEELFPLSQSVTGKRDCFMIKVKGNSMIKASIYNGDKLIVNRQSTADNGDIVVALVGDFVTVKRFYLEGSSYRLQPENDDMEPIILNEVEILGKVIGIFRDLRKNL